jgi:hypothetical protein
MGKRSDFPRRPRDAYPTPEAALLPLLDHLEPGCTFEEPCCGDGDLVRHLENFGHICLRASDIAAPSGYSGLDAREIDGTSADCFITNPPWQRDVLHGIIENLSRIKRTFLLIDADWMHTKQAAPYMAICRKIVSIGRVKWIPESKNTGKDNCCWYLFDNRRSKLPPHLAFDFWEGPPTFHPRRND